MTYSEMVPVVVGSKIIDRAMNIIAKGELMKMTTTWKQDHFGAVMSGPLQLPHVSSNSTGVEKEVTHSSPKSYPMEVREFYLDDVRCPVCTTQKVTIPPFSTVNVHTSTSVKGHCMWVHVLTKLTPGPQLPTAVVAMVTYGELHLGSLRVPICLCNLGAHSIEIPAKTVVGQVAPANQVPPVVLLIRTSEESNNKPQKGWVLEALDLQGLREWPKPEQEQARELLLRWEHQFAHSDLDLCKTALIKHKIEVMDWTSFNEHYQHISPHMYDDVRAHIQELLDIGAIWKLHSPWASAVVLFWRKNGSLRFCIDLRMLNNWTIKDAYLLPHIG